jgi:hypothetical protein
MLIERGSDTVRHLLPLARPGHADGSWGGSTLHSPRHLRTVGSCSSARKETRRRFRGNGFYTRKADGSPRCGSGAGVPVESHRTADWVLALLGEQPEIVRCLRPARVREDGPRPGASRSGALFARTPADPDVHMTERRRGSPWRPGPPRRPRVPEDRSSARTAARTRHGRLSAYCDGRGNGDARVPLGRRAV